MTKKELKLHLCNNEPALYKSIGKYLHNPKKTLELIICHYQWNYQYGNFHENDMGSRLNSNYKLMFVYIITNFNDIFSKFMNIMIKSLRVAYNFEKKTWDKEIIMEIIIKNKYSKWFDLLAFYTLIAGNYDDIYELLPKLNLDENVNFSVKDCKKLFNLIVNNKFANELIDKYEIEWNNLRTKDYV